LLRTVPLIRSSPLWLSRFLSGLVCGSNGGPQQQEGLLNSIFGVDEGKLSQWGKGRLLPTAHALG
jgi:hypothetical protein